MSSSFFQKRFWTAFTLLFWFSLFLVVLFSEMASPSHPFPSIAIYSLTSLNCSMVTNFGKVPLQHPRPQKFLENGIWGKMWDGAEVSRDWTRNARRCDASAISLSQFSSQFQKDVLTGPSEMGMEKARQMLHARIAMALYYQKDLLLHPMLCRVFVDSELANWYVNGASYIHNILETQPGISHMAQEMWHPSTFEMQL